MFYLIIDCIVWGKVSVSCHASRGATSLTSPRKFKHWVTPKNNLNQLVKYVCLFYDLRETVASPCVTSEGTFFLKHPLKKRFLEFKRGNVRQVCTAAKRKSWCNQWGDDRGREGRGGGLERGGLTVKAPPAPLEELHQDQSSSSWWTFPQERRSLCWRTWLRR